MWVLCAPLAAAFVLGPVVMPPAAPLRTSSPTALALPAVPLLVPGIGAAALSFLGLGFPPDFPTWGRLLFDATDFMQQHPERVMWPGLAISLTVLSVNYMGDGLRDALDPRIRGL